MPIESAGNDALYGSYMEEIRQEAERLRSIPLPKAPDVIRPTLSVSFNSLLEGNDRTFVVQLHQKLLNREPDDASLSFYMEALKNGTSAREDIICQIALSKEAAENGVTVEDVHVRRIPVDYLLRFHGREFIKNVYLWVLGRRPDQEGMQSCLGAMDNGYCREELLHSIRFSPEGIERGVVIPGLKKRYLTARAKRGIKRILTAPG